ncbi:hypothetical protein CFOL_v3_16034 [Cephalotus follicularis]|uniref:UBN2 domain-containing protein n=1 Tax=Cephalotus follicularis TaxID=3775 RepID=A0A1Q3BX49_CEPFO|nr:hypothetical protein CFOL_v3_16034 [Cephalotus follicularis]
MSIFIQALDFKLWNIIIDGPDSPTSTTTSTSEGGRTLKQRHLFNDEDRGNIQLNAKAKHVIICALNSNEFNRVYSCSTAKEMWDSVTHQIRRGSETSSNVRSVTLSMSWVVDKSILFSKKP